MTDETKSNTAPADPTDAVIPEEMSEEFGGQKLGELTHENLIFVTAALLVYVQEANGQLIDLAEVCRIFGGVAPSTVYALMKRDGFPQPMRLNRKMVRWWLHEVIAYLRTRKGLPAAVSIQTMYRQRLAAAQAAQEAGIDPLDCTPSKPAKASTSTPRPRGRPRKVVLAA